MNDLEVIKVTAAIIIEGGLMFITRRLPDGRHPGAWEFPGGKVEIGETVEACMTRELFEELGITVEVGERLAEVRHAYPDLVVDLIAFDCTIKLGPPKNLACAEHAWVRPAELHAYDLLPADRKLLEVLLKEW